MSLSVLEGVPGPCSEHKVAFMGHQRRGISYCGVKSFSWGHTCPQGSSACDTELDVDRVSVLSSLKG